MSHAALYILQNNARIVALTPLQRWQAVRQLHTNLTTQQWFNTAAIIALCLLASLFLAVTYHRKHHEKKIARNIFDNYARRAGLSGSEYRLLLQMAKKTGLKHPETIFTLSKAFNIAETKIITEHLAQNPPAIHTNQLKTDLLFLRQKLGFLTQPNPVTGLSANRKKFTTHQIPAGKTLQLTQPTSPSNTELSATVIKNDPLELTVKLPTPLQTYPGQSWRARYGFGAHLWEFDTAAINCDGRVMTLNHTGNLRCINRRRFLRVPTNKPALIARFPFSPRHAASTSAVTKEPGPPNLQPPHFVPAVLTELAGPGLRLSSALNVKTGDRVLVVFSLHDNSPHQPQIVEDLAQVRHTKTVKNGLSIAVELLGLNDSELNTLIRATNTASLEAVKQKNNIVTADNPQPDQPQPAIC